MISTSSPPRLTPAQLRILFDRAFDRLRFECEAILDLPTLDATPDTPIVTVNDLGTSYQLTIQVPGAQKDTLNLEITTTNITLTRCPMPSNELEGVLLRHERPRPWSTRYIELPDAIDPDNASAHLEEGILTIQVTKLKPPKSPQRKILL